MSTSVSPNAIVTRVSPAQSRRGEIGTKSLLLARQRGDELRGTAAAVKQVTHVRLGPAQGLERGDTLQGLAAGDVEDHRIPGGGRHGLRVLPQAAAAEIGPGVLGRV